MSDVAYIALFLCIGSFIAVHCSRATMREWRAGRALGGKWGDFERESSPARFWLLMAGNALATIMGGAFLLLGFGYLFAYFGWIE